jgi:MoxR-like ATPase
MFNKDVLQRIAVQNQNVFETLGKLQKELSSRFVDMDDAILALILSVAAGEPLLLVGSPGTAKSRLIRSFCSTIGLFPENSPEQKGPNFDKIISLDDREHGAHAYFEYLLTPFTEPNELFGYYDIGKLMDDKEKHELVRDEAGMMHLAYVVYLDEVFNASSAILNSLLAFLQERIFHDRGKIKSVKTRALFAASNRVPDSAELKAVFDRFLLRCYVKNVELRTERTDSFPELLQRGWRETYQQPPAVTFTTAPGNPERFASLFTDLKRLQDTIRKETTLGNLIPVIPNDTRSFYHDMRGIIAEDRLKNFSDMSNRRVIKMLQILLLYNLYRSLNNDPKTVGREFEFGVDELKLINRYFLDRPKERQEDD